MTGIKLVTWSSIIKWKKSGYKATCVGQSHFFLYTSVIVSIYIFVHKNAIWKNLVKMLIVEIPSGDYFFICFFEFSTVLRQHSSALINTVDIWDQVIFYCEGRPLSCLAASSDCQIFPGGHTPTHWSTVNMICLCN